MKLACISDVHGKIGAPKYPAADVLVLAGDIMPNLSRRKESDVFLQRIWADDLISALKSLGRNYDHIVMIPGNHDRVFQIHGEEMAERFDRLKNIHLLVDSSIVLDGKKFYGSPWSSWFHGDYWAFNLPENVSREEIEQDYWGKIPHDVDVLITHGPPYGIMDRCQDGHLAGCKYLLEYVNLYKPSAHIFGHIHEGYGQAEINGIKFVNAALMNVKYAPVNEPQVIEI